MYLLLILKVNGFFWNATLRVCSISLAGIYRKFFEYPIFYVYLEVPCFLQQTKTFRFIQFIGNGSCNPNQCHREKGDKTKIAGTGGFGFQFWEWLYVQ